MPEYVPVAVPAGTSNPQKTVLITLVVLVGDVNENPFTDTSESVKAVLVPGKVKVEVEYLCELVVIVPGPESVTDARSLRVVDEFPELATVDV